MTQTQLTKIKETKSETINVPEGLIRGWNGLQVFVYASDDTLVIKKIKKPDFWETWKSLKKASKDITKKDIDEAVKWARSQSQ